MLKSKIIPKILSTVLVLGMSFPTVLPVYATDKEPEMVQTSDYEYTKNKVRTIVTSDGELDDSASFIRFLYYANEFDIEGLIYSSSRWHRRGVLNEEETALSQSGSRWFGTNWMQTYIGEYEKLYPKLIQHDPDYPSPDYLRSIIRVGNIDTVNGVLTGDGTSPGSRMIADALLNDDPRPLYVQGWGGPATFARALMDIEDEYKGTDKWEEIQEWVSKRAYVYIIQDQDQTYRNYIRNVWPNVTPIYNIDNFETIAYSTWNTKNGRQRVPMELRETLYGTFMKPNFLDNHGKLLEMYPTYGDQKNFWKRANLGSPNILTRYPGTELEVGALAGQGPSGYNGFGESGDNRTTNIPSQSAAYDRYAYISEGDSPSFLMLIDNGLRSLEKAEYGGWGGRFHTHTVTEIPATAPEGTTSYSHTRWWDGSGWNGIGPNLTGNSFNPFGTDGTVLDYDPYNDLMSPDYSIVRWVPDWQHDFAARADWGVMDYAEANHAPTATVTTGLDLVAAPGMTVQLNGSGTDPDGDSLNFKWWNYAEAGTYGLKEKSANGTTIYTKIDPISIEGSNTENASITIPQDAEIGDEIHVIFEVEDNPDDDLHPMKSYQRVIITVGTSVHLNLSGDVAAIQGEDVVYTVSAKNMNKLATATLWIEVDGEYLNSVSEEGMNGFSILNGTWSPGEGSKWIGQFTLTNMEGGVTSAGELDILTLSMKTKDKLGSSDILLKRFELSGYDEHNIAVFMEGELLHDTITTEVLKSYSKYDVNRDGKVDQLDLTTAQRHYASNPGDANWNQYADVNDDGRVDVEDLILILNNINW